MFCSTSFGTAFAWFIPLDARSASTCADSLEMLSANLLFSRVVLSLNVFSYAASFTVLPESIIDLSFGSLESVWFGPDPLGDLKVSPNPCFPSPPYMSALNASFTPAPPPEPIPLTTLLNVSGLKKFPIVLPGAALAAAYAPDAA
jgi:hypothetical protein